MTQSPAQFAVRTLRALEVLAFTPTTAPKLADALGVHPRTARRLLSQLQRDGWLSYSSGTRPVYAPTLRLVALAAHIGARAPLATLTAGALEQLHAEAGLPAVLAIPAYNATVCIARCVGARATDVPLEVVEPAHGTAAGKVLLAHRDAWRRSILSMPLKRSAGWVALDPEELERELAQVRLDGCASASVDAVGQLAVPVVAPGGEVLAAIGVVGAEVARIGPGGLSECVRRAGQAASDALVAGAKRYPMHRTVVYRVLASYGLDEVDAYL
jgi:DNA-binding IclR family transcriptional regulator